MKLNDVFPSNYLKAEDLNGREVNVSIREYKMEKMGDDTKLVLYFFNKDKGMVCNKTNASMIALVLGDDLDHWIGNNITIGTEMVSFQGKASLALRVKNASKALPKTAATMQEQAPFDEEPMPF